MMVIAGLGRDAYFIDICFSVALFNRITTLTVPVLATGRIP